MSGPREMAAGGVNGGSHNRCQTPKTATSAPTPKLSLRPKRPKAADSGNLKSGFGRLYVGCLECRPWRSFLLSRLTCSLRPSVVSSPWPPPRSTPRSGRRGRCRATAAPSSAPLQPSLPIAPGRWGPQVRVHDPARTAGLARVA